VGGERADARWRLLDAEELASANPRSFFIPSRETRSMLGTDELVKLVFEVVGGEDAGAGERMWVRITDTAPGGYVGTLENEPVVVDGVWPGARIEFEPRHVIDVWREEGDPLEDLAAFVSARLLEDDGLEPGVVTFDPDDHGRELGDGRTVTGWQLFVGDETPDELDDPERIRLPSLAWLVQRYPDLLALVETHDGAETSWVRGEDGRLVLHQG
jgi:uncharacterized protein YegJ (DUF2314 family)